MGGQDTAGCRGTGWWGGWGVHGTGGSCAGELAQPFSFDFATAIACVPPHGTRTTAITRKNLDHLGPRSPRPRSGDIYTLLIYMLITCKDK